MAIEAPYSKYGRTNFKIGIVVSVAAAIIFAYDGYLSKYAWSRRRAFYDEHTKKLLFNVQAGIETGLDSGIVSEELRQQFEESGSPLSQDATVLAKEAGSTWLVTDTPSQYVIRKEDNALKVYKEGPDQTMMFNRISPIFFIAAAAVLALWLRARRGERLVADGNQLVISDKVKIRYDSIEKIEKTHFESKGYFIITFKDSRGREVNRKLSDRKYDNLAAILDHLVAKIS